MRQHDVECILNRVARRTGMALPRNEVGNPFSQYHGPSFSENSHQITF